ncbi:MAG: SAM-dependent methyltransferase [Paracoccus sp. (in: a-proteobacteria)]|nr:SAM-dependent methyltransferase [Paracoccus sp. (in: a-proteobacteria)]
MAEGDDGRIRPGEVAAPMPADFDAQLYFIGRIRSPYSRREDCPRRGDAASGPDFRLEINPRWQPALAGLAVGDRVQVLYWMHLSRRDLLLQTPQMDGVTHGTFALRSPVRPNPIASTVVPLLAIEGGTLTVRGLDCVDGTPILDIKPASGRFQGEHG